MLFGSFKQRQRHAELMDAETVDPDQLRRSLRFLRRVNRLFGYTRASIRHLQRFSRTWEPGRIIKILDVATGSGDIPQAVANWARRRGFEVRIVALDRHSATLHEAKARNHERSIQLIQADALQLPFDTGAFDYAMTSTFLHHLSDDQAVVALREMARVSRRGIIAADLLRSRRAYLWVRLFTSLANPVVRHDGPVSIKHAFSRGEILRMRDQAGLEFAHFYPHFGHRFVLAGERH
jgi:ubiquinone/menaquinone biosynthesis C-methylase UbiE